MIGDFNAILVPSEKRRGSNSSSYGNRDFISFMSDTALVDMGFAGPSFTWFRDTISEHLDRALCNVQWRLAFPESYVRHMPRIKSDHRPILLVTHPPTPTGSLRPFRFQAAWLTHPDFQKNFQQSWLYNDDWFSAYDKFTIDVARWNRDVFGNIFRKKRKLKKQIESIEIILGRRSSTDLVEKCRSLRKKLEAVLLQEEILWFQKSRSK